MKILVVGGGGREHALCARLAASPKVKEVLCAPGNAGIGKVARRVDVSASQVGGLVQLAAAEHVDLVVVGPEEPLVRGLADDLTRAGIPVFGPGKRAAQLEGSKAFAKKLMRRHNIPTAEFKIFEQAHAARDYLENAEAPLVVKCDGLAAGKGVRVCATIEEAQQAVTDFMDEKIFGDAGDTIVVEECLRGEELSVLVVTDGRTLVVLESARDHKRLGDGDAGPNTGGMGAFSPSPRVDAKLLKKVEHKVLLPLVHAMNSEGHPFRGVLYAGLMLTPGGPKVLEFNVRFGDPETQAVLPRLQSDLAELLLAAAKGGLDSVRVRWDPRPCLCVVLASEGYPEKPIKGRVITGLDAAAAMPDVSVFHAGTERSPNGETITSGGRVLGVSALGADLDAARERAYAAVDAIHFEGMQVRRDIGKPARS